MKLASELQRRSTGSTVYVLDEPTTGLHFEDIRKLLDVLNRLVDGGNTVVVIEHNLDVIKTADWVIDMGPEGGFRGGEVVATGTPEEVVKIPESHTGRFLAEILRGREVPVAQPEPEPLLAAEPPAKAKRTRRPKDAAGTAGGRSPAKPAGTRANAASAGKATKAKQPTTNRTPAA